MEKNLNHYDNKILFDDRDEFCNGFDNEITCRNGGHILE